MKVYIIYDGHASRSYTADEIVTLADFSSGQLSTIGALGVGEGCELISKATGFILQIDRGDDLPEESDHG